MIETMNINVKRDESSSPTLQPQQQHQHKKIDSVSATECANCGTTTTPLWRRGPNGETICNACGLYLKARNTLRPPTLKRTVHKKATPEPKSDCGSGGTCPGGGQCNGTGGSSSCAGCPAFNQHQVNRQALICANCRTTTTPLWRRDEQGNTICNACGLYYKLHNVHRPVSMKRSVIKRRKRIIVAQGSDEEEIEEDDNNTLPPSTPTTPATVAMATPSLDTAKRPLSQTQTSKPNMPVPEIEDYVVLKKKKIELPHKKQHTLMASSSLSPPQYIQKMTSPSPIISSTTSSPAISSIRSSPPSSSLSDKIYTPGNNNNNNTPLFSKPFPEPIQQQPQPQPQQQSQQSSNKSFLPPISSERQSYKLESLFGRRESTSSTVTASSTASNNNHILPPLSLPPLTPPSSQQQQQQHQHQHVISNNQDSHNRQQVQHHHHYSPSVSMSPPPTQQQPHHHQQPSPPLAHSVKAQRGYELADFDTALDRLEHLRRQVRPEQAYALSQLTQSITDLAAKAEAILSLDSLAYGR